MAGDRPTFVGVGPLAIYDDALQLAHVQDLSALDYGHLTASQQDQFRAFREQLHRFVADGPAEFDSYDVTTVLLGSASAALALNTGPCDGYVAH